VIPETRGKKRLKYDFDNMEIESFMVVKDYGKAIAVSCAANNRGHKVAIRTVEDEIRVYYMGKR